MSVSQLALIYFHFVCRDEEEEDKDDHDNNDDNDDMIIILIAERLREVVRNQSDS